MKKTIFILLAVAAIVSVSAFSVEACTIMGKIEYTVANPSGQYIYVRPYGTGPFTSIVYSYWIPNAATGLAIAAQAANGANENVQAYSGIACPTTPATGVRPAGTLTQLIIQENF